VRKSSKIKLNAFKHIENDRFHVSAHFLKKTADLTDNGMAVIQWIKMVPDHNATCTVIYLPVAILQCARNNGALNCTIKVIRTRIT